MANHDLNITIISSGTITVDPEDLHVDQGDNVNIIINRPDNNNAIYCGLLFDKSSNDQNPFTGTTGGITEFELAGGVMSKSYPVVSSARVQSDSYTVALSASTMYFKDPTIKVGDD